MTRAATGRSGMVRGGIEMTGEMIGEMIGGMKNANTFLRRIIGAKRSTGKKPAVSPVLKVLRRLIASLSSRVIKLIMQKARGSARMIITLIARRGIPMVRELELFASKIRLRAMETLIKI